MRGLYARSARHSLDRPKKRGAMPIVNITIVKGRSDAVVEHCVREVARAVSRTLDAPLDAVRVYVTEVMPNRWAIGDTLKSD